MRNRNILIVSVIILIIILIGGAYYFVFNSKKSRTGATVSEQGQVQLPEEMAIPTLSPQDIGLTLSSTADLHKVIMAVANTADISSLDYQLSYTAKGNIPRGVLGHIDIKVSGNPVQQEIILGTCSDVCHYDQEVSDIKLVLKVTKNDNKIYQVEQFLD